MKPATPLPWKEGHNLICGRRVYFDSDAAQTDFATVSEALQDRKYLVHACNAYPRLVEALRAIAKPALGGKAQQYAAQAILRELGEE